MSSFLLSSADPRLERVLRHLEAHMAEPLDIAALARIAGMSHSHFQRSFRAAFGETVGSYVRNSRLRRAAERLRDNGEAIVAIAQDSGYNSQTAFSRAFGHAMGTTPQAYRDRHRISEP